MIRALAAVVPIALLLAGCQSARTDRMLGAITPYRVEIVQGNVVTKEQAALLKPGLTRNQVRDVLGTPLLADPFHADRWDYVFTIRRQGTDPQIRRVTVHFQGDTMTRADTGDDLPGEREFVASIDTSRTSRTPPPLTLTEEQLRALPAPPPAAPAASAPEPAPRRTYPPLEAAS